MAKPGDTFPLSPAQQEIWLAQLQHEHSAIFTIGECLEFPGVLDPECWRRACRQLVTETETLRLRVEPAKPACSIAPALDFPLPVIDLRGAADPGQSAERWVLDELRRPFAFDGSPLFRFALLPASGNQTFFYYCFHHIVIDGLGVILIIDRLAEIYSALAEGRRPAPSSFPRYQEKVEYDATYAKSDAWRQDRDYWVEQLKPAPALVSLAVDAKAPARFCPGIRSTMTVSRAVVAGLCEDGVSLTQALLAALAIYAHLQTGEEKIVPGLTVGGRASRAMRNIPGLFSNLVPVPLTVRATATFESVCREAGQGLRHALRHQRFRIEDIERALALPGRAPLRRLVVNVISQPRTLCFGGLTPIVHDLSNDPAEDLVVQAFDFEPTGPLSFDFLGHPDLYAAEELVQHQRQYLALLTQLASGGHRQQPLGIGFGGEVGTATLVATPATSEVSFRAGLKRRKLAALWESHPLSGAQLALGMGLGASSTSSWSPVVCVLAWEGPLDLNRVETALGVVVQRHEQLRLARADWEGIPRQTISTEARFALSVETRPLPPQDDTEAVEPLPPATAEWSEAPWLRARVVRIEANRSRLVLDVHPWAADAASMLQIANEIAALIADPGTVIEPLKGQRLDEYIAAEAAKRAARRGRSSAVATAAPAQDADAPRLPFVRKRPGAGRPARAQLRRCLAPETARVLHRYAETWQATTGEVALATFLSLLARTCNQAGLNLSVVLDGRPAGSNDTPVGSLEYPCRLDFDVAGQSTFGNWVAQVKAQPGFTTRSDRLLPLSGSAESNPSPEDSAGTVLFRAIEVAHRSWLCADARVAIESFPTLPFAATLALDVVEVQADERIECRFVFDSEVCAEEDVRRFAGYFLSHLDACLAAGATPLHAIPVSDAAERRLLLDEWNRPVGPRPERLTFPELFQRQVRATPEAVAVEDATRSWTYQGLNARANDLARRLRDKGARPEAMVGILLDNSLEAIVAIVGVLKSGAAYLPLDPANPRPRLDFMVADAGIRLIVTRRQFSDTIDRAKCSVLYLEEIPAPNGPSGANPDYAIDPDHLAYIIYTSGTTGNPKGVMVPHACWTHELRWVSKNFGYGPGARVLQFSSLGFDVSAEEIGGALISGATLYCATRIEMFPGPTLTRLLAAKAITHVTLSPSALAACPVVELPALRRILLGGEACPPELAERWGRGDRLVNGYGPTETTIIATCDNPVRLDPTVTIGRPIDHYRVYVLDPRGYPAPLGVPGELFIGGAGVTRGYLAQPGLTAERFVPDSFGSEPGARLYRSGDLVKYLSDGRLEFCGRVDGQVKIRGFRIELGEIASVLRQRPGVLHAAAVVRDDPAGGRQIVAYVTGQTTLDLSALCQDAGRVLPAYMVPAHLIQVADIPLTPNGKVDSKALARRPVPAAGTAKTETSDRVSPAAIATTLGNSPAKLEHAIAAVWSEVLGIASPAPRTNFFELGGNSLLLVKVQDALGRALDREIPILTLFKHPTIRSLAEHLGGGGSAAVPSMTEASSGTSAPARDEAGEEIAIIGMAGRFPGANDVDEFWRNLRDGREGIARFEDEALRHAGVSESLLRDPHYVKAVGAISDVENFDASFFGFSPREASLMDPQHRIFLEIAWHALEHAGYDPGRHPGAIGVYAGAGMNTYRSQLAGRELLQSADAYLISLGNDKDFIPTRTSYKLNLRGPSLNVNTACSSSLVAVHLARQALLGGECDMALAGGVSVIATQTAGYLFHENGIFSPDGHCRAFSANAQGTVPASGAGVVVLKRLSDAVRDRDTIYAVIQGSAINNDGAVKVGYTAPSVEGQVDVIRKALRAAQVNADAVGYVETHGTGTELGDPIEVEALTKAFAMDTARTQFCAIGSVKSNLGHVDSAAGAASLIKTALSLAHNELPPSLHCDEPNPAIDFAHSPFYVNNRLRPWARSTTPRICGVSSFGIGGTNAHVVVREAPVALPRPTRSRNHHLLLLSGRNRAALDAQAGQMRSYFETNPAADLPDVAFTLAQGRKAFASRRFVVCGSVGDAREQLDREAAANQIGDQPGASECPVAFLFPGQGSQYAGMAAGLYAEHAIFRTQVDACCEILRPHLKRDLRELLFATGGDSAAEQIHETEYAQPALFVVEYALAQLWISWGVRPTALIGHSVGEIVAACVAGVLGLDDALALVARRGQLMQSQPPGAMVAVAVPPAALAELLRDGVELATHNGADRCVVAGDFGPVAAFEQHMAERGLRTIRLNTSHAFHSAMMEAAVEPLVRTVAAFALKPPQIPVISNDTGTWLTAAQATDPSYWGRHLRRTVRFHDGLTRLLEEGGLRVLVEVGPGRTLRALAERHPASAKAAAIVSSLPGEKEKSKEADLAHLLGAVGRLWLHGAAIDWNAFYAGEGAGRVPLPTYPFQRERHWIEPSQSASPPVSAAASPAPVVAGVMPLATPGAIYATATETEAALVIIWSDLLGAKRIGINDSFFELGGDSLIGVQLLSRIRDSFGMQLSLQQLFEAPTIAGLAVVVEDAILAEFENTAVPQD